MINRTAPEGRETAFSHDPARTRDRYALGGAV